MCAVPGPKSNENNWLHFWCVLVLRTGDTAFFFGENNAININKQTKTVP
jgi:hypothetical protein